MDAGTWHTREWSGDFLSPPLPVRGYLLMLNFFACMEKVRWPILASNYSRINCD
jgi:hypothetical protein